MKRVGWTYQRVAGRRVLTERREVWLRHRVDDMERLVPDAAQHAD